MLEIWNKKHWKYPAHQVLSLMRKAFLFHEFPTEWEMFREVTGLAGFKRVQRLGKGEKKEQHTKESHTHKQHPTHASAIKNTCDQAPELAAAAACRPTPMALPGLPIFHNLSK